MARKPQVEKTEHKIFFDIDSTSIGGMAVRYDYSDASVVINKREIFSMRKNITNGNEYPFERFFDQTLATLKYVAEEIHLRALVPIDSIHINIGTPWESSQKRIITQSKKKPFTITQEITDELIERDSKYPLSKNVTYSKHDVEVINRSTIDIYINGYPTRKPIGKEAREIEIHSLASVMSSSTKKSISDVIAGIFHTEAHFHPNTFVNYQSVRLFTPDVNSAIVLDISGEVTSVLVIHDDHLIHNGSFPVGANHILRGLRDALHVPMAKAYSLVRMHTDGALDDQYQKDIQSSLNTVFRTWFKSLYNLLDTYAKKGLLPHTVVLKSHNDTIEWMRIQLLQQEQLNEHIHSNQSIEMIIMKDVYPDTNIFSDAELGIASDIITLLHD